MPFADDADGVKLSVDPTPSRDAGELPLGREVEDSPPDERRH